MAVLYDFIAALKFQPGVFRFPERKDICTKIIPRRNDLHGPAKEISFSD